jgi:uncharacterized protein with FMN-binding domain
VNGDPLERMAHRQTVRRGLAFVGVSAAIVLSVVARAQTAPPPVSALSSPELAKPVGGSGASTPPPSTAVPSLTGPSSAAGSPGAAGKPTPATKRSKHIAAGSSVRPRHSAPTTSAPPTSRSHSAQPTTAQPTTPQPAVHTTTPPPATTRTLTGSAYDVGYGVVQVRVTVRGSHLVDVTAVSMPQGGHSGDITAMAEPQLRREAISAQSAHINAVSGATYTSSGYAKSLQSALDKAAG